ncbi:MAG: Ig-like domain-containing protein [Armatimonadota bacterium]
MSRFSLALIAVCALTCGTTLGQTSRAGIYQIQIAATPTQVPADGQTQARIRIDLRDQNGRSVRDGTSCVVHTDVGFLSLSSVGKQASLDARTVGGYAIVFLTSPTPGTATITVQAADSRSLTYVDFLPQGEVSSGEARVLDVKGGWVGYSLELSMIEARDRATVTFGKLTFECGGVMQISIDGMTLKAQDVVVRRGDQKLAGEDVYFDLATKRGVLRRFGDEKLERVSFDAISLKPSATEFEVPDDAFKVNKQEADTWLIARSISFFLREKVVLRGSALWIQQQKVFTFPPYWIIGLPGYTGATNTQALGMTSSGGLALDFPFFYRVTDQATGAIRIQRGARASSVTSRDGWSVAVSEEYRNGSGTEGSLELGGLPRSDWGFEWSDSRPMFGNGFSYANFALPDHRSVFADSNLSAYRANGRLSLRTFYDDPKDYAASYGAVGDWLGDPRPIGDHNLSYRFGTSLAWRRQATEAGTPWYHEMYSELSFNERSWGKKTTLQPSVSNVFDWDPDGNRENNLRAELRLDHKLRPSCSLGLDYSAEFTSGNTSTNGLSQVLALDLRANHGSKWQSYLNGNYGLENGDLYGYMNFDYYMNRQWRWGVAGTYYSFEASQYQDLELSLGRLFGDREVSVNYSADTGHFSLAVGGFGIN